MLRKYKSSSNTGLVLECITNVDDVAEQMQILEVCFKCIQIITISMPCIVCVHQHAGSGSSTRDLCSDSWRCHEVPGHRLHSRSTLHTDSVTQTTAVGSTAWGPFGHQILAGSQNGKLNGQCKM